MAISAYDDNHFAFRKTTRNQAMVSSDRKLKRRLPLWLYCLIILVIVGGVGGVGWFFTHPSAHRSPATIAADFTVQVGNSNWVAAASDVDPANRATTLATLKSDAGVPGARSTVSRRPSSHRRPRRARQRKWYSRHATRAWRATTCRPYRASRSTAPGTWPGTPCSSRLPAADGPIVSCKRTFTGYPSALWSRAPRALRRGPTISSCR